MVCLFCLLVSPHLFLYVIVLCTFACVERSARNKDNKPQGVSSFFRTYKFNMSYKLFSIICCWDHSIPFSVCSVLPSISLAWLKLDPGAIKTHHVLFSIIPYFPGYNEAFAAPDIVTGNATIGNLTRLLKSFTRSFDDDIPGWLNMMNESTPRLNFKLYCSQERKGQSYVCE